MKETRIKFFTTIGLITVILLQSLWLFNTYHLIKFNIEEKCNTLLFKAVEREVYLRFNHIADIIPDGTELSISGVYETGDIESENLQVQEALLEYNSYISLADIDSIYSQLLQDEHIYAKSVTNLVNRNCSVIQSSKKNGLPTSGKIITQKVPIRVDGSQNIQAIIVNPYWAIFEEMGVLLIATVLMVIFVVACIVYQIKIIIKQNRIAQIRTDFSHAMIHDMKTPITSIIMGTQILRSGKLDEYPDRKKKHFDIMEDEANHILALANKVLTIAKLEQSKLNLHKTKFPIRPIINDLVEKFNAKNTKPTTFVTVFETETVYADQEYLKEVMSNLIDNAIKYSHNTVEIMITCAEQDGATLIKVKDNGFGIPLKDQTKIFEKFERASATGRSHRGGATGFGLGLNYVQRIIEAHDGKVSIESIEGEYSEFTVSIPILIQEI